MLFKCLNYISIYIQIKRNIIKLKRKKSFYLTEMEKITSLKDKISKNLYSRTLKKFIKVDKIINNEIKKNIKIIKFLNKLNNKY